jgi:hypothetical protein
LVCTTSLFFDTLIDPTELASNTRAKKIETIGVVTNLG